MRHAQIRCKPAARASNRQKKRQKQKKKTGRFAGESDGTEGEERMEAMVPCPRA